MSQTGLLPPAVGEGSGDHCGDDHVVLELTGE